MRLLGTADPDTFPLQKKRHTDEFLRTIAHLRPRTNKYGALFRIRSEAAFAVHQFFRDGVSLSSHPDPHRFRLRRRRGNVSGVNPAALPAGPAARGFAEDFFGKEASLTVSGQLEAELFACALGNVYTFGPTFRAENSNTPRHAAEFWMIEPEMAFADLLDDMDLGEELVKEDPACDGELREDLELFARFVDRTSAISTPLPRRLREAFLCRGGGHVKGCGRPFEFPVDFGADLQTEHERFLCEEHFKKPVIVYDYPREIKAFYMRLNDDDKTVAAMDLLVPRVGELIGGSQREERHERARTPHPRGRDEAGQLLVVSRHPPLRLGAPRRIRPGVRAFPDDGHGGDQYPRCDSVPPDAKASRILNRNVGREAVSDEAVNTVLASSGCLHPLVRLLHRSLASVVLR